MPAFSFEKISPPLVRDNAAPEKTAPASVKTTRSVLVRMLDRLSGGHQGRARRHAERAAKAKQRQD